MRVILKIYNMNINYSNMKIASWVLWCVKMRYDANYLPYIVSLIIRLKWNKHCNSKLLQKKIKCNWSFKIELMVQLINCYHLLVDHVSLLQISFHLIRKLIARYLLFFLTWKYWITYKKFDANIQKYFLLTFDVDNSGCHKML